MKFEREDQEISGGRKLYLYHFGDIEEAHRRQEAFWSGVGESWRTQADVVERWFEPVTREMISRLGRGPGRLLDFGCGSQSMQIPEGWHTIGLDIARLMLRPHSRAVVGACNPLPIRSETFDAGVSRFALMFASDAGEAFAEAVRVLKPGGRLVLSVWGAAERNLWSALPNKVVCRRLGIREPEADEPHAFRLADPDETRRLLAECGLCPDEPVEVSTPFLQTLEKHEALEQVLSLAGPLRAGLDRMAEAERTSALVEISEALKGEDLTGLAVVWSAQKNRP